MLLFEVTMRLSWLRFSRRDRRIVATSPTPDELPTSNLTSPPSIEQGSEMETLAAYAEYERTLALASPRRFDRGWMARDGLVPRWADGRWMSAEDVAEVQDYMSERRAIGGRARAAGAARDERGRFK